MVRLSHSRRRPGVSLVEVLVMSMIGIVLLGVIWMFFTRGHAQSQQMEFKLKGIQDAQLLIQRIEDELKQAVADPAHLVTVRSDGGTNNVLEFYRVEEAPQPSRFSVEKVVYQFDPDKRIVLRNGQRASAVRLCELTFELRERTKDPDPLKAGTNVLLVRATGIPDELANKPLEDIPLNKRATLLAAVGLVGKTLNEVFELWKPEPIGPFGP